MPLVEGVAFEQFVMRVRRRLGLPDAARVTLQEATTGVVDTIDRLLEVDEGVTLEVTSDVPSCLTQAVSTSATAATHRPVAGKGQAQEGAVSGLNGSTAPPRVCRVDIPVSEWARSARDREDEEGGDGKYRKKRRVSFRAVGVARWSLGLAALGGMLFLLFSGAG